MRVRLAAIATLVFCLAVLTACGSGSHGTFGSSSPTPSTTPSNPSQPSSGGSDSGQTPGGGISEPGQTPGGGTNNPTQPGGGSSDPGQTPGGGTSNPTQPGGGSTDPTQPGGGSSDPGQIPGGGTSNPTQPGGGSTNPTQPGGGSSDPGQTPGGGTSNPTQPGGGSTNPTQPGGGSSDPGQTPGGGTSNPTQPGGGSTDPTQPGGGSSDPGQTPGGGTAATLTSIQVLPASLSLPSASTRQFSATGTYSDGSTKDVTSSVAWSTSAAGTATVNSTGLVTALGPGQATITASSGSATPGSGTVSVLPSALTINTPSATLGLGQSQQLTAVATYADGPHDVTASVTWTSDDSGVVTVNTSGLARALAIGGPVTITGTLGSMAARGSISVGPPVLAQIRVAPAASYVSYCGSSGPPFNCSIGTHQVLQLQATGIYSDGHNADVTAEASWQVDTDHTGNLQMLSAGLVFGDTQTSSAATISASIDGVSGTAGLTVSSSRIASAGVMVAPDAWTLPELATKQFTATAVWTDGSAQDITTNPVASWSSDNTSVAIVGPSSANTRLAQGMAQGLAAGTANISVMMDGESASAALTVVPARLTTISVTPATASIPMMMIQQYTAVGIFTDNTVSPPQSTQADITNAVTWSAADSSIASIDSGGAHPGLAVPLHVGQTTISATLPGAPSITSAPVTLNVTGSQLSQIVVTPVSPKVGIGAAVQFAATAKFSDGSVYDLTDYFNWSGLNPWSSSNAAVASITDTGYASTLGLGRTTIKATVAGVSGSTDLTVTPAQLRSVIILPSTQSPSSLSIDSATGLPTQPTLGMTPHSRIQLKAYGYYTDQTFQTLTGVIWSAPTPRNLVVITGSGVVIAKPHSAGGTVTIKATVPGSTITGTVSLVVAGAIDSTLRLLWNGSPVPAQVAAGTGLQFSAWATSGGTPVQDVTTFVQWTTSDPNCAVVSSTGFATGRSVACTAQITATYNNQSSVASNWTLFTVTNARLTSISIAPANSSLPNPPVIPLGASQQLNATGTFNDATTQDLTGQVSWSSSDIGVVVIRNTTPGLAVSSGTGTATVSATLAGNSSGTTQVTVTTPPAQ